MGFRRDFPKIHNNVDVVRVANEMKPCGVKNLSSTTVLMKMLKQMGKDSQPEKLSFYINQSFSYVIVDKLLLLLSIIFSIPST